MTGNGRSYWQRHRQKFAGLSARKKLKFRKPSPIKNDQTETSLSMANTPSKSFGSLQSEFRRTRSETRTAAEPETDLGHHGAALVRDLAFLDCRERIFFQKPPEAHTNFSPFFQCRYIGLVLKPASWCQRLLLLYFSAAKFF
jgi:hypothetical protein